MSNTKKQEQDTEQQEDTTQEHDTLMQALLALQQEMPKIDETAANPYFGSQYAPLDHVLDIVEPRLHQHGLIVYFTTHPGDGSHILTAHVHHIPTGEELTTSQAYPNEKDPHAIGKYQTYYSRYLLRGLLGLRVGGEDDDGNAAKDAANKKRSGGGGRNPNLRGNNGKANGSAKVSAGDARKIRALCESTGTDESAVAEHYSVDNIENMTTAQASQAIAQLNAKSKKAAAASE